MRCFIRGLVVLTAALSLDGCALARHAGRAVPVAERPGRQPAERRDLVFSGTLAARGGGPVFVMLDSARVYRVEPADGSVRISPRLANRPYPRELGSLYGDGLVIQPRVTGEHRIDTEAQEEGVVEVRIWRDEADQVERRCVREPRGRACVGDAWAHGRTPLGFYLMFLAVPVVAGSRAEAGSPLVAVAAHTRCGAPGGEVGQGLVP